MATRSQTTLFGVDLDLVQAGRLLVPVVGVVVWELCSLWLGSDLLPGPVQTLSIIFEGFTTGDYGPPLLNTLTAVVSGFLLAAVAGFALGVLLGTRDFAYDLFEPFVVNIYAIPKIVLFPLFLFVFQLGLDQKIAFGAFHGFFPMLIVTMGAIREVPQIYLQVSKSLRLSEYQLARYILFPFVLVQVVVGLRLAFSLTFLGVILAELFASKSGLGLLLQHAMASFNTRQILAIVTVLMIIAFAVNYTMYRIQQHLEDRWNISVSTGEV